MGNVPGRAYLVSLRIGNINRFHVILRVRMGRRINRVSSSSWTAEINKLDVGSRRRGRAEPHR